jgi:zinc protease
MPKQDKPATRLLDAPVVPKDTPAELTTTDDVSVPKVIVAFRTDAPYTSAASDLELAAQILGGGKTSRLYRRLVMKDRLATEVEAFYSQQMLGGELQIHAIARDGVDVATLRKAIDEEVAKMRDELIAADELARARRTIESDLLKGLENIASRAESIAAWDAYTGDPDYLAEELALLDAVTPDSLEASAKTWLATSAAVTMIVTPEKKK